MRGIEYLAGTQNPEGSWTEDETTGTGFPQVFYLKYDMYRNAWPLLALATYQQLIEPYRDPLKEYVHQPWSAEPARPDPALNGGRARGR